jgi:hypothetical protein
MALLGDWSPAAAPGDEFIISGSISLRLGTDTISAVTGSIAVYQGVDSNAAALALAPAAFNGSTVSQLVGGSWIATVVYRWAFTVTTAGGQTLEFWAHIPTVAIT